MNISIEDRLRSARKSLNLTQEELGKTIGLSRANITNLESGKVKFAKLHAIALERVHKISSDWLLTGKGSMFLPKPAENLDEQFQELKEELEKISFDGIINSLSLYSENLSQMIESVKHRRERPDTKRLRIKENHPLSEKLISSYQNCMDNTKALQDELKMLFDMMTKEKR